MKDTNHCRRSREGSCFFFYDSIQLSTRNVRNNSLMNGN